MPRLLLSAVLLLLSFAAWSQKLDSEDLFKQHFITRADSLDAIEGIWNVSTTQEFYRYDTLSDVRRDPIAAQVAIMKKEHTYESYNLTGESYDVEFQSNDVKGVYLYRNFFRETKEYSKTQAVICKAGDMEYTYDLPHNFLRAKFEDRYEEGTRVVNILQWTKVFPEARKK